MRRLVLVCLGIMVLLGPAQAAMPAPEPVRLPKALFWCLRWEWESKLLQLPGQAKAWAEDLAGEGRVTLTCGGQSWEIRVE